jgi:hypothetical protein
MSTRGITIKDVFVCFHYSSWADLRFVEELEFIHLRLRISPFRRVARKFIYRFEKNKFETFLNLVKIQKKKN